MCNISDEPHPVRYNKRVLAVTSNVAKTALPEAHIQHDARRQGSTYRMPAKVCVEPHSINRSQ